jgi:hypothetical protein
MYPSLSTKNISGCCSAQSNISLTGRVLAFLPLWSLSYTVAKSSQVSAFMACLLQGFSCAVNHFSRLFSASSSSIRLVHPFSIVASFGGGAGFQPSEEPVCSSAPASVHFALAPTLLVFIIRILWLTRRTIEVIRLRILSTLKTLPSMTFIFPFNS